MATYTKTWSGKIWGIIYILIALLLSAFMYENYLNFLERPIENLTVLLFVGVQLVLLFLGVDTIIRRVVVDEEKITYKRLLWSRSVNFDNIKKLEELSRLFVGQQADLALGLNTALIGKSYCLNIIRKEFALYSWIPEIRSYKNYEELYAFLESKGFPVEREVKSWEKPKSAS